MKRTDRGVAAVEYALLLGVVSLLVIAAVGMHLAGLFRVSTSQLCTAAAGTCGGNPVDLKGGIGGGGFPIPISSPSPTCSPDPTNGLVPTRRACPTARG